MAKRTYDPLAFVPSPDFVRQRLRETLTIAERLRLLLGLSEQIHNPTATADNANRTAGPPRTEDLVALRELVADSR